MVAQSNHDFHDALEELQTLARVQQDRVTQLEGRLAELERMLQDVGIDSSRMLHRDADGNPPNLAGSLLYYSDLISPIDVEWEADQ